MTGKERVFVSVRYQNPLFIVGEAAIALLCLRLRAMQIFQLC